MKSVLKKVLCVLAVLFGIFIVIPGICTLLRSADKIYTAEKVPAKDYDCILVLGASVRPGGIPSPMLADRLDMGLCLYEAGKCNVFLMSGDHAEEDYNEVGAMLTYVTNAGVPGKAVFLDHSGLSTYESIYRAIHVYGARKILIVTQKYHLYRALSIATALGADAVGVAADSRRYAGAVYRECREVMARSKDFYMCLLEVPVSLESYTVDLTGDGTSTHEKP